MTRSAVLLVTLAALCVSAAVIEKRQVLTAASGWPYGAASATAAFATAWPSAYGAWPYAGWPALPSAAASIPAAVGGKPVLNYMSASSLQLAEAIAASHPNKDTKITVINRA
ncbi:hypothetical protein PRIPAC_79315 [Pristionchus pacificus]|uniref:Uncharacterized protein n=1 Tax=Pristionchus pacificus TaxID=54126 RepID=A0A2A6BHX8_PRIPA|nr:hypothetical protein PRIPAC_79315 [Pristionchus pacificus]|eukprot:PDM65463.1 hypothetical protein PRIPAC_52405 [Pristionchus pacificus]